MEQTLTKYTSHPNFNRQCEIYKDSRLQLKKSQNQIMTTIQENTKEEVKQVKRAIEQLNQKVDSIMTSPQIKQVVKKAEKYQNIMKISLKNATETFQGGLVQIDKNPNLSETEKQKYRQAMYEKLMAKLYSPQEIQTFQNKFSNVVMVVPPENFRNQRALPGQNHPMLKN